MTLTTWQKDTDFTPDATVGVVASDSAAKLTTLENSGGWGYFQFSVAFAEIVSGDPNHHITVNGSGGPGALAGGGTIPWHLGTKRGSNSDHHTTARDQIHDLLDELWASAYGGDGEIDSSGGGITFARNLVTLPKPPANDGSVNAANVPARAGIITPDDAALSIFPHALAFSCPTPGANPVFPANPTSGYSTHPANPIELGQWIRANPAASTATITDPFELKAAKTLQAHGAICRDVGSTFTFYCADAVNFGGNTSVWVTGAGVTIPLLNSDGYPYARQWSTAFVNWLRANLQILNPPTPTQLTAGIVVPVPTIVSMPVVTGTPKVGQMLTCSQGTWTGTPTSYAYQWVHDGHGDGVYVPISGATSSSYTPTDADDVRNVRCLVIATNASGDSTAAASAAVSITEPLPVNSAVPTVTGTVQVGHLLSGHAGTWSNMSGFGAFLSYQWFSSPHGAGTWTPIAGASSINYTPVVGDVGKDLRLEETAHNSGTA